MLTCKTCSGEIYTNPNHEAAEGKVWQKLLARYIHVDGDHDDYDHEALPNRKE